MSKAYEGNLSEILAVCATIDPEAQAASAVDTDVIDMANFDRVLFIVQVGEIGSSGTVDFAVKSDSASGGSYATTQASMTQLTQAGSDADKTVLVEVRGYDVAADGHRYIKGTLTTATAASDVAVVAIGTLRKYAPASLYDLTSVDEIVAPAS